MGVRRAEIRLATNSAGGGTVLSNSLAGEILEIRYNGTTLNNGGSADYTITRHIDGGTVLALSNTDGPWTRSPRQLIHTTSGGTLDTGGLTAAITSQVAPVPVEGAVQVVIAQGAASKEDTIYVFYCNE